MLMKPIKVFLLLTVGVAAISLLGLSALGNKGYMAPGGDLIGSLPISYPDSDGGGIVGQDVMGTLDGDGEKKAPNIDASLTLRGTKADVEAAISDAYGVGWVVARKAKVGAEYIYSFFGNIVVELDRTSIESQSVRAGIHLGTHFKGGLADVTWSSIYINAFTLNSRQFNLPYGRVLYSGAVDAGDVGVSMHATNHIASHVNLSVIGNKTARITFLDR